MMGKYTYQESFLDELIVDNFAGDEVSNDQIQTKGGDAE